MQQRFSTRWTALVVAICFVAFMATVTAAPADTGAMMKPPAMNAAVVATMPGFQDLKYKTFFTDRVVNEGLVIRQSRVENGKIIIPKYGLYYTTRTAPAEMLKGEKTMILGKMYTITDVDARFDVLANVFAKHKKPILFGDGSKGLELTDLGLEDNGYEGVKGTFKILKPSVA